MNDRGAAPALEARPIGAKIEDAYVAPWWLPGGNLQTLYAALLVRHPRVEYRRERWDTPDGDFIDVDRIGANAPDDRPLLALFHGLEGCSNSHYAHALMARVLDAGWHGAVVHFRGCSGAANRLPRAYHSGDSAEIGWVLERFRSLHAGAPLYAAGVSLGGNALLKWLGESGLAAANVIAGAAAVSAPVDLMRAGDTLGRGFNLLYTRAFLRSLKRKSLAKLAAYPHLYDGALVRRARTLREFDELVTAPLHGFRSTDDYWTRASSKPWLGRIAVPTLMVNARNDPFLPGHALPDANGVSRHVTREFPAHGGHVGFVSGPFPGNLDWLPRRIMNFFGHRHCVMSEPASKQQGQQS